MKKVILIVVVLAATWWLFVSRPSVPDYTIPSDEEAIERGHYLVRAGGCISCHEGSDDRPGLSGGKALESDFGIFHASNITPDEETGIGGWNGQDFVLALKHGHSPDDSFYYPAFPYRAYAGMSDEDALAIAAWLMVQEPVAAQVPEHELPFWMMRWQMAGWIRLAELLEPQHEQYSDPEVARGAYLARHLGHCSECHTPRNNLGILRHEAEFTGGELAGDNIPAIDAEALSGWSETNFSRFLFLGLKPDGEFVGGEMGDVIEHNTSELTEEDREALAAFFIRRSAGEQGSSSGTP